MKKGFTLIELLAVIVILAIIALIAIPVVIHIINDSKKSSDEQSLELYRDSVQKAIANYQMQHPSFNPTECVIQSNGDIDCGVEIPVEMKGTKPSSGTVTIKNNKAILKNIKLDGKIYYERGILVDDSDNDGEVSIGDKYTYKVNERDTFNFYVLSLNDDNTVNLIMDRNICNDGTVDYTETNNYCRYKWHIGTTNNNYGPDTAMQELYKGTKNWTNVPDIVINYTDENNNSTTYGYTSITTNNGMATIIGKNGVLNSTIGTNIEPLKVRLPMEREVNEAGCTGSIGSCPVWLMENLTYYNGANNKYSINDNSEAYQKIWGYWLLPSSENQSIHSRILRFQGNLLSTDILNSNYGIRPVITVSINELS